MSGESAEFEQRPRRLEDEELARQCEGLVAMGEWLAEVGPGLLKRAKAGEIIDGYPRNTRLDEPRRSSKGDHSDPTFGAVSDRVDGKQGVDPIGDAAAIIRRVVPAVAGELRDLEKIVSFALPPAFWLACTCPLQGPLRQVKTVEGTCLRCGWAVVTDVKERNETQWCVSCLRFGTYKAADGRRGRCLWCYRWSLNHGTLDDPPEAEWRQHQLRLPKRVDPKLTVTTRFAVDGRELNT